MKTNAAITFAIFGAIFGAILAVAATPAQARNDVTMINIEQALKSDDAKSQLDPGIKFYFGSSKHPAAATDFGESFTEGKSRGDTDLLACNKAFLEALGDFQKKAKKLGADSVVKVHSYFKKAENFSTTQIECHSGSFSSVVYLKGQFINTGK